MPNIIAELQQHALFSDIPDEIVDQCVQVAQLRSVRRGDLIVNQGEHAEQFFIVRSGCCRLVQHTVDGRDVTLATFVAGDAMAMIVALAGRRYPGSIEVLKNGDILCFPALLLAKITDSYPLFYKNMVFTVHSRLCEAHERIRELSTERVEQRIAHSILRLAEKAGISSDDGSVQLSLRLSRQDIAQLSGTTFETVSRTLKDWERAMVVRTGREQIAILDEEQLMAIAVEK